MKVKAVDIAKKLEISTATVSLALNDREGVSEKTKERVLECKRELEMAAVSNEKALRRLSGVVKYVVFTRGYDVASGGELEIGREISIAMDRMIKNWGGSLEIEYYNGVTDTPEGLAAKCNRSTVAGVVVAGAEMEQRDRRILELIQKPVVVSDADLGEKYSCVVFNNAETAEKAVNYLLNRKLKKIMYLACDVDIYNFEERRKGFKRAMQEWKLYSDDCMLRIPGKIEEGYLQLKRYLKTHELPEAFIAECYPVSIALIRALRELKIEVPQDVSLIGIDELPEYFSYDCKLSTMRVPHEERMKLLLLLLCHEIEEKNGKNKSKLFVNCDFIVGNTVV